MNLMQEVLMPIEVLAPEVVAAAADTNTSRIKFNDFRRIMFYVGVTAEARDSIQAGEIVRVNLREATAFTAGTTELLKEEIDIVGGVDANEALLWVEGHADGDDVTVNGVTLYRTTAGYDGGANPDQWNTPAELIARINALVPGVTATGPEATHGVRVEANDPSETLVNVEEDIAAGTSYASTTKAGVLVECYVANLTGDHRYVYCHIDNDVTANDDVEVYCVAFKGLPYHSPCKQVVAAKG